MEKICSNCGELKDVGCFGKVKRNKDGLCGKCKICMKEYKKEYKKEHRLQHKDKIRRKEMEYYENHKEERNEKAKEYYGNNKEGISKRGKKYYKDNRDKIIENSKIWALNNRDKINKNNRNRTVSDNYKISRLISARILRAVKTVGTKKCDYSANLLGCTIGFYMNYIEAKFTQGMTWENQGNNGWHFDHIKPCKSFDLKDPVQQYLCFNYTNYQPLWATTTIAISYGEGPEYVGNLEKGDKVL